MALRNHLLTTCQEFEGLQDDETIYKQIGPVLLKQEKFEAENTVKGRLDFIGSEMYVFISSLSVYTTNDMQYTLRRVDQGLTGKD